MIFVLPRYGKGGPSSRVRFFSYFSYLKKKKISLNVSSFFGDTYLKYLYGKLSSLRVLGALGYSYIKRLHFLLRIPKKSTLWLEKEFFPYCPGIIESFFFRRFNIILDLDDAWHLRYQKNPFLKNKIALLTRLACHVIAANPMLKEWASQQGQRQVTLIPTSVTLPPEPSFSVSHTKTVIGWIGTPITEKYLNIIRGPLEKLAQTHGIELIVMGGGKFQPIPNLKITFLEWSVENEKRFLPMIDVGVMPLIDSEWERYKSGYKLLQYMSYGKPVVGSPVGVNKDIIDPGRNGYLATTDEEWYEALEALIRNPALRKEYGKRAYATIKKDFSIEKWSKSLYGIFEKYDIQRRTSP